MNKDQAGYLRELAEGKIPIKKEESLPPRRQFHQSKKKRRVNEESTSSPAQARERKPLPLIKVIAAAFLLLIAVMFTYDWWSHKLLDPVFSNKDGEPDQVQIEK